MSDQDNKNTSKHITHNKDIVFITLDTLRFDVAQEELLAGRLPTLNAYFNAWEKRHSPGSFTYASHQAFFAGFLPTPYNDPKAPRLFALKFPGSETTSENTLCFETPDIIAGFKNIGYKTLCVGGVGFFNKLTPLGSVIPSMFDHSFWSPELGVGDIHSTENQITTIKNQLDQIDNNQRIFLFLNISAIHQPNCFYMNGESEDSKQTHAAALQYVDKQLATLFEIFRKRHDTFYIICSDHGTAYGEDGYEGHRLAHDVIWTVPYANFTITARKD